MAVLTKLFQMLSRHAFPGCNPMTDLERFLQDNKFFRCERLEASITQKQCEANRTRKDNLAASTWACAPCVGCPGLGETVILDIKEGDIVEKKICKMPGCTKFVHARGMCWAHERSVLGINPQTGLPVNGAAPVKVKAKAVPNVPAPVVSVDEITSLDYIAYLRQILDDKLEAMISQLNSASNPRQRAEFYISMCDAAEGLGL